MATIEFIDTLKFPKERIDGYNIAFLGNREVSIPIKNVYLHFGVVGDDYYYTISGREQAVSVKIVNKMGDFALAHIRLAYESSYAFMCVDKYMDINAVKNGGYSYTPAASFMSPRFSYEEAFEYMFNFIVEKFFRNDVDWEDVISRGWKG